MSSEDQNSKTEEPTRKKLKDARKKGQVARSEELVPLFMILFSILYFWFNWDNMTDQLKDYMGSVPTFTYGENFRESLATGMSVWLKKIVITVMLPFSLLMLAVGIIGNVIQFGFLFAFDPVIPKPEKINPVMGFKRVFSAKQVVKTLLSIVKITAMAIIVIFVVRLAIYEYMHDIKQCDISCQMAVLKAMLKKMLLILIPVLVAMVLLDLAFQKFQFRKEQRMTKDEVKREYKNMEGDPLLKGARRQEQRRMLEQDIKEQIKLSRIVVAGMRKAVAIMYEKEMPLPILLAIGRDRMSYQMIQIAKKEGVPVVADAALVNILETDGAIDQYIPASSIKRVAAVLTKSQKRSPPRKN